MTTKKYVSLRRGQVITSEHFARETKLYSRINGCGRRQYINNGETITPITKVDIDSIFARMFYVGQTYYGSVQSDLIRYEVVKEVEVKDRSVKSKIRETQLTKKLWEEGLKKFKIKK